MADDTSLRNGQDRQRIDIHQDFELRDWAKKFDTTPEQLKEAVKAVGDHAEDVEMYLKGSHATTNADQQARAGRQGD